MCGLVAAPAAIGIAHPRFPARPRWAARFPPWAHHLGSLGPCQARGMRGSEPQFASAADRASWVPLARGARIVRGSRCGVQPRRRRAILWRNTSGSRPACCCTGQTATVGLTVLVDFDHDPSNRQRARPAHQQGDMSSGPLRGGVGSTPSGRQESSSLIRRMLAGLP